MKFLKYAILVLSCIIWVIGLSPALLSQFQRLELIQDGYHYGDLYRLSNLSDFREPRKTCTGYEPPVKSTSKNVHLYVIGDSFTEKQRLGKKDFPVDNYTYVHWSDFLHIKTDSAETNILLIESIERHFRQKMVAPIAVLIPDTATFVTRYTPPKFMHRLDDAFKSTHTEDRLDALLFQNDFFLKLKEWKADFNQLVFNRVNKTVTLVNDDKDMVYYMDTDRDTTTVTSSFSQLENSEVDSIVLNLNRSRDMAYSLGFDAVMLSIIPNKVSVLNPHYGQYNNLIERIYKHPNFQIPYIDVLAEYRKMGASSYLKGDSHWTCEAQFLWLNKTNALLNQLAENP
jgi:hypothetical protein